MIANMSVVKLESPAIIDRGPVSRGTKYLLHRAADDAVAMPGYVEAGRYSRRITIGDDDSNPEFTHLTKLARKASETYLDRPLTPGSVALVSMIIDAKQFQLEEHPRKAASYWHQDFAIGAEDVYGLPDNITRLVIPLAAGFRYVTGDLRIYGGSQLTAAEHKALREKTGMLALGPVVTNHNGVLLKSEKDPQNGVMYEAPAGHALIVPPDTVHKSQPDLPDGRICFILDSLAA